MMTVVPNTSTKKLLWEENNPEWGEEGARVWSLKDGRDDDIRRGVGGAHIPSPLQQPEDASPTKIGRCWLAGGTAMGRHVCMKMGI